MSMDPSQFTPQTGADGLPGEIPVIAYTEHILAQKEAVLRKYIEENYTKIQNVEKELASLALEVKLTSGSKKAALEHLRKKIEQSAERSKAAKVKEENAKKALEAATKLVEEEEAVKKKLCDDLNLMVQESAMAQYEKLEELTRKLDALNPEMAGGAMEALEGLRAKIAPHGAPLLSEAEAAAAASKVVDECATQGGQPRLDPEENGTATSSIKAEAEIDTKGTVGVKVAVAKIEEGSGVHGKQRQVDTGSRGPGQHVALRGRGRGRGRGLVGKPKVGSDGGWTGSGFDVEDRDE